MAAFPKDKEKARDLILNSSIIGVLCKVTRMMTKTPVELYQIPSKENYGEGLRLTHKGFLLAREENIDEKIVNQEMVLLEKEVNTIISSIEGLGNGSIARGAIRAFEEGTLDIPLSPSIYNKNRLIAARDCDGTIRFINPEQIP